MNPYLHNIPLPLRHGCLFVDNSFLEHLQTCARLLEYSDIRKRIPAGEKASLNFGSVGHLVLDHRYRNYGADITSDNKVQLETEQSAIVDSFFKDHPLPPDSNDFRTLNWAIEVFIKQYNLRYPIEPFNLLAQDGRTMVEQAFALPFAVYSPAEGTLRPFEKGVDNVNLLIAAGFIVVFYMGRIDLPLLWDGHLFIMDHKSTGAKGSWSEISDEFRVAPQILGYCWSWEQLTGERPKGFVVNFIKTWALPLRDTNKDNFAKWWEEKYFRLKEYIYEDTLSEWHFNTLVLIEEFLWHHRRGYYPQKKKWCVGKYGKCSMYNLCANPNQEQRLESLESPLFMDNVWSPLEKSGAEKVLEEVK